MSQEQSAATLAKTLQEYLAETNVLLPMQKNHLVGLLALFHDSTLKSEELKISGSCKEAQKALQEGRAEYRDIYLFDITILSWSANILKKYHDTPANKRFAFEAGVRGDGEDKRKALGIDRVYHLIDFRHSVVAYMASTDERDEVRRADVIPLDFYWWGL